MSMHPELGYFDEGLNFVEPKLYAAASRPFGRAQTLPPAAYRSKIFADLEDEKIWTRTWVCVGAQQQIPNAGDLLPFTLGHHGIHVERQANGGLIARFNKAQHGGCRAVPAQCQTGIKTKCSFTSCGYSRDRDVIHAAEVGEGSRLAGQYLGDRPERLLPAKVETWGPFVFVNLNPDCEPLAKQIKGLAKRVAPYFNADLKMMSELRSEIECNWKLAGRAYLEDLAPPFVTDNETKPTARTTKATRPDRPLHSEHRYDLARSYGARDSLLQMFPGLSKDQQGSAQLFWFFPNLLLALMPDHVLSVVLQPTATAMTLQRIALFAHQSGSTADLTELNCQWREALNGSAADAESRQRAFDEWGSSLRPDTTAKRLPKENSTFGYDFQKFLVECILAEHEYYWAAPLYSQPGR